MTNLIKSMKEKEMELNKSELEYLIECVEDSHKKAFFESKTCFVHADRWAEDLKFYEPLLEKLKAIKPIEGERT